MSSPVARLTSWFALHCTILLAACGSGGGDQSCTVDSDCASHFCRADGTCGPAADDPDGGMGSGSGSGSGSNNDLCTPNHDGTISADEVPLAAGKMANFRVATDATWNTAGAAGSGNERTWDLTGALSNDSDGPTTLTGPTNEWWKGDSGFAGASYYTQLAAGSDLLGVFKVDSNGVTLLGVVSPTKTATYTEITYDPPATILKVPMKASDSWTSSSSVVGYYSGSYVNYTEVYTSNVDQSGTMKTPYGEFPVLRIGTVLQQKQLGSTYNTVRNYAWMAECFGTVAKVSSQNNESNAEFSDDAEVRRIIP
ncbi:MAG: hypothetical protein QM831_29220 [Kofleriaceae bacterium]